MTLERRFEETEFVSKKESLRTRYLEVNNEILHYKKKLKTLKNDLFDKEKSKTGGALSVTNEDIKQMQEEIAQIEKIINEKSDEFKNLMDNANSLARKHLQSYNQYMTIKSLEGSVTISMISLLLASIILLLHYPFPLLMLGSSVSSWFFSAGLILLLIRVILHGRDPEREENKRMLKSFKPFLRK